MVWKSSVFFILTTCQILQLLFELTESNLICLEGIAKHTLNRVKVNGGLDCDNRDEKNYTILNLNSV